MEKIYPMKFLAPGYYDVICTLSRKCSFEKKKVCVCVCVCVREKTDELRSLSDPFGETQEEREDGGLSLGS